MQKHILILVFIIGLVYTAFSQVKVYELDMSRFNEKPIESVFKFNGKSPDGTTLGVNNQYWTKNGKPWIPIMGEFHYSRYPHQSWEEEIQKMKSGGINTVATYVFWEAHENPRGQWNWNGDFDLKEFVALCKRHDMYVWLRIGPYCNAELLHGGFPAWIASMKGKRTNDPDFLRETRRYYDQVGKQVTGMFFKDGGPIIGIQVENEYASGQPEHPDSLKQMALDCGMVPVYFSLTANSVFHDNDFGFLPLQGSYSYRGWEKGGGGPTQDFLYGNDQWILNSSFGGKLYYNADKYPRGLCEQGCGSQMELKNRFTVDPAIVEAHLQNQIGRGMNLIGYYMFHGGTTPTRLIRNGYPASYDFQSPLSEFGEVRPSYRYLKILHHFMNDFGSELAAMQVVRPEKPVMNVQNTDSLRYIARIKGNSGFVFLNNSQVRIPMPDKKFRMKLKVPGETIEFPRIESLLKGETTAILPFNMDIDGVNLKYATAQPLARLVYQDTQYLFLMQVKGMETELAFDSSSLKTFSAPGWNEEKRNGLVYLTPRQGKEIKLTALNGNRSVVVLLTRSEAENTWRTNINGQESLIVSSADVLFNPNEIELNQFNNKEFKFKIFPAPKTLNVFGEKLNPANDGLFATYKLEVPKAEVDVVMKRTGKDGMEIIVPQNLSENLCDIFLDIDYLGSGVKASINGQVMADHLFHGPSWLFGTKRYMTTATSKEIKFEVEPWNNEITGVSDDLLVSLKKSKALLKSVTVLPQYRIFVKW